MLFRSELHGKIKENQDQIRALEEEKEKLKEQFGVTDDPNTESSEYQQVAADYNKQIAALEEENGDYQKNIAENNGMIRGIKQERLKSNPMLEAQNEADAIREAGSKELVGMLVEESKEHIEEIEEEKKEEAQKKAEKEEKEEELKEKHEAEKAEADRKSTRLNSSHL